MSYTAQQLNDAAESSDTLKKVEEIINGAYIHAINTGLKTYSVEISDETLRTNVLAWFQDISNAFGASVTDDVLTIDYDTTD